MNWISLEELLLIHDYVIENTGGIRGIVNPGGLESSMVRPFTSLEGQEVYIGLELKVAVLIHSIIMFHPFADGNKRVALVAADICLRLNGKRIIPSESVEDFFWSIAKGEQDIEQIRTWIESNIERWRLK